MESSPRPSNFWRNFVAVFVIVMSAASMYFCWRVLQTVDRLVTVMENVDRKIDKAAAAGAPIMNHSAAAISAAQEKGIKQAAKDEAKKMAEDWLSKQNKPKE